MIITILGFIAAVITIYFTWNFVSNRKKAPKSTYDNEIRYYELKSKYEFLVATGSLLTIVVIFFGINTQKDLENELRGEYKSLLDSAAILKNDVNKELVDNKQLITLLATKLQELQSTQQSIFRESSKSLSSFNSLNRKYNEISSRPILKNDFFIVQNVEIRDLENLQTFYFKDLKTIDGTPLPKFDRPPSVFSTSNNGAAVIIFGVTNESVTVSVGTWVGKEAVQKVKFLIFQD